MMEEWKTISSTTDRYEISSLGTIHSLLNVKGNPRPEPKVIKPWQTGRMYSNGKRGSLSVKLTTDNGLKRFKVHHLVLEAFVGPRPEDKECAHLDGDIINNRLDNLKWVTHAENENHKRKHETLTMGEQRHNSKLTENDVREIRRLAISGLSSVKISEKFPIDPRRIRRIINRQAWKHVE